MGCGCGKKSTRHQNKSSDSKRYGQKYAFLTSAQRRNIKEREEKKVPNKEIE